MLLTHLPLVAAAPDQVEQLLDDAFGHDRIQRTAYRLRAGRQPIADLSFLLASETGQPVAVLQSWQVALRDEAGAMWPLVLVGPVAVAPARQGEGLGTALMHRLAHAAATYPPRLLVGDPGYYGRFGYSAAATGGWRLPGPVERHRLLSTAPADDLPAAGEIVAAD